MWRCKRFGRWGETAWGENNVLAFYTSWSGFNFRHCKVHTHIQACIFLECENLYGWTFFLIWRHIDGVLSEKSQNTHNLNSLFFNGCLGWKFKNCWNDWRFKEWVSFFLGSWGMNRSAGQTNRVNRVAVLVRFVCSALRFIPHEPRKKTLIPYIYNASNKDPF